MTGRFRIGYAMAALGVLWVLATLALDIALHVAGRPGIPAHLGYASLVAGAVISWWGFFWADSKRAKEGGTYVLDAQERLHAHRRATDPPPIIIPPDETPR